MTVIDNPRAMHQQVLDGWLGAAYLEAEAEDQTLPTPLHRSWDRAGLDNPDDDTTRYEWDIDLTAQEQTDWDDMLAGAKAGMKAGQWAGIKAEALRLSAYYVDPAPTNADSVQAIKDLIKAVKVMWNDES